MRVFAEVAVAAALGLSIAAQAPVASDQDAQTALQASRDKEGTIRQAGLDRQSDCLGHYAHTVLMVAAVAGNPALLSSDRQALAVVMAYVQENRQAQACTDGDLAALDGIEASIASKVPPTSAASATPVRRRRTSADLSGALQVLQKPPQ